MARHYTKEEIAQINEEYAELVGSHIYLLPDRHVRGLFEPTSAVVWRHPLYDNGEIQSVDFINPEYAEDTADDCSFYRLSGHACLLIL